MQAYKMNKNPLLFPVFFTLVFASLSCNTLYKSQTLEYQSYQIHDTLQKNIALVNFLTPYKVKVNSMMNNVIGYVEKNLDKKLPEGELGNFMADAYLQMAREKFKTHIDVAFMNYGGIRLNQLSKGNITNGKIFELMPFDNLLILQKVKGNVLQDFLDLTANQGGWPVAGLTMQMKNKKAFDVMINGKKLEPEHIYIIANSDYVANGGGDAVMLKDIQQISIGYLMRDALFDYIESLKREGKSINAKIENRVTYFE